MSGFTNSLRFTIPCLSLVHAECSWVWLEFTSTHLAAITARTAVYVSTKSDGCAKVMVSLDGELALIVNTTDLETNDAKPEDEDLNLDEPTDPTTMHE